MRTRAETWVGIGLALMIAAGLSVLYVSWQDDRDVQRIDLTGQFWDECAKVQSTEAFIDEAFFDLQNPDITRHERDLRLGQIQTWYEQRETQIASYNAWSRFLPEAHAEMDRLGVPTRLNVDNEVTECS